MPGSPDFEKLAADLSAAMDRRILPDELARAAEQLANIGRPVEALPAHSFGWHQDGKPIAPPDPRPRKVRRADAARKRRATRKGVAA